MKQSYESYKEVFEDYHGIITPSSSGVLTRDSNRLVVRIFKKTDLSWLACYFTSLLTGENNLPLGVQLIGNKLDDLRF